VFDIFATILAWFYAITHNYAIAIALLTLCVMIVLTPLTLKGTKSMLQLQKLQPQVKRLQAEHKGDRQKLNEEMMALYKEHRINPLSGCLPLLLQAPIFFILYRVLSGLTRTCPSDGEIGGVSCASVGSSVGTFFPDYVKQSSELFQSLVGQTEMLAFGLDLSKPATQQLSEGFINGLPYLILVLVVGALSYYQQRQVSSRMKDNVNPQQQMIMKVLPAFFALISLTLPAGLIVYFITSSCYRIAQQAYITRRFYRDEGQSGDDSGNGAKKGKPAPKPTPASTSKPKPEPVPRPTPKRPTSGRATPPQRATNPTRPRPTPRPPTRPTPKKK
jgi:YidC/Oxa1 family membrane protein insertase